MNNGRRRTRLNTDPAANDEAQVPREEGPLNSNLHLYPPNESRNRRQKSPNLLSVHL